MLFIPQLHHEHMESFLLLVENQVGVHESEIGRLPEISWPPKRCVWVLSLALYREYKSYKLKYLF